MLDQSEYSKIPELLSDSITTKEIDYVTKYSQDAYLEFLKWDAIFKPEYQILTIEQENDMVKVKISKIDKRIQFLHEEPIITEELLEFSGNKIKSVAITKYSTFNDTVFSKNRGKLVDWIAKNHPELNDFLTDQTEAGGQKYLKALQLFTNQ